MARSRYDRTTARLRIEWTIARIVLTRFVHVAWYALWWIARIFPVVFWIWLTRISRVSFISPVFRMWGVSTRDCLRRRNAMVISDRSGVVISVVVRVTRIMIPVTIVHWIILIIGKWMLRRAGR